MCLQPSKRGIMPKNPPTYHTTRHALQRWLPGCSPAPGPPGAATLWQLRSTGVQAGHWTHCGASAHALAGPAERAGQFSRKTNCGAVAEAGGIGNMQLAALTPEYHLWLPPSPLPAERLIFRQSVILRLTAAPMFRVLCLNLTGGEGSSAANKGAQGNSACVAAAAGQPAAACPQRGSSRTRARQSREGWTSRHTRIKRPGRGAHQERGATACSRGTRAGMQFISRGRGRRALALALTRGGRPRARSTRRCRRSSCRCYPSACAAAAACRC